MAISIAYGIAFATILTLVLLPIFLSFGNWTKVHVKWLATGNNVTKEEVERAIKEMKEEESHAADHHTSETKGINTSHDNTLLSNEDPKSHE